MAAITRGRCAHWNFQARRFLWEPVASDADIEQEQLPRTLGECTQMPRDTWELIITKTYAPGICVSWLVESFGASAWLAV